MVADEPVDAGPMLGARMKMSIKTLAEPVETLKIDLRSAGGNQGALAISWETTEASIPFTVLP